MSQNSAGTDVGMMRELAKVFINEMESGGEKKAGNRFKNVDVGVKREGTKIVLPSEPVPMNYDEAIDALLRRKKEEETTVSVNEVIDAFPFDGAHAFMWALKEIYGWASPVPTPSFFGPRPPETINVEIEYGKFTTVIWGRFAIPGLEGNLATSWTMKDGRPVFKIAGEVKKRFREDVAFIAQKTREYLKENSLYKGKAISFKVDENGHVDFGNPPSFLDLSRVNPEELTFSDEVAAQVQTNLFTPIEHTQACRMHHIPLKRGVLLEGPFGTGKTLTAFVTANKARKHGWTFILIDRVTGLDAALKFARTYQPAVVFAEDVDRAVSGEKRTIEIDDILNTIDGIESKGSEVITILTSNDVKGINRAMLRPGRLDAIISVQAPDAKAAERLIRLYSRGLIGDDVDLADAGKELRGQIPAVIREVVERSKLYAIGRAQSGKIKLTSEDIVNAARGMKNHLALLNPVVSEAPGVHEQLGRALADVVEATVNRKSLHDAVMATRETTDKILSVVQ